jgi:uncharacterized phage protein gp47/JayE
MSQSTATVPIFSVNTSKTQAQIRGDILRTLSNSLRLNGIANPNTGPNSDYYGIADGVATEIVVGVANSVINTQQTMPDTATGSGLDRWLALFGLSRKPATPSSGVIFPAYALAQGYTLIPGSVPPAAGGAQLLDSAGLRYQVTQSGSYGPGNPSAGQPANLYVPVQSVDAGSATDHANGDQLTWVTLVPYVGSQATVGTQNGTDGLEGGNDSEATTDGPPRQRLFATLQNPPGGGNWSDVASWARASTPIVQDCGVYPALLGPATVFFAVWQAPQVSGVLSSTSKNRAVAAPVVSGTVVPYVQGQYSTRAAVIGASAANLPVDVCFLLSLPAATTAQPSGPGGGWLDGTPWPSSGGTIPAAALSVASTTELTVIATTPPQVGVSRVAYISPTNWSLYTATVIASSPSSGPGPYAITLDTPWPNLPLDFASYPLTAIFPQSVQQLNYLAAAFTGFGNLGPGEWSTNPLTLVRSFRHPSTASTWFANLDANFLRTMENAGQEVLSAQYIYRSQTAPAVPSAPTITTAEPLALLSPPPAIFVPRSISWYAQ